MVINNHQGIILHIIIVLQINATTTECFRRHLMFYTCNYNIRVTHRNGAIHIFYTNQIHGGIIKDCSLIHFVVPMRLLFI